VSGRYAVDPYRHMRGAEIIHFLVS